MLNITLETPVGELTRIGKTLAARLQKLGIKKARDLLFYFPYRYIDYSKTVSISELVPAQLFTVRGIIEIIKSRRSFRRRMFITEALVSDSTGQLKVIWFNQPYLTKILKPGDEVFLSGELDTSCHHFQFTSPIYEKAKEETIHTARIIPLYSLTKSLTQKQLRYLIKQAIPLAHGVPEWIPQEYLKRYELAHLPWALEHIHFPKNFFETKNALKRLKFDEALRQQIKVELVKRTRGKSLARPLLFQKEPIQKFIRSLSFELTKDQRVALWQILQDMQKPRPMRRMLEGDVGSGKTIVAFAALYNCALNSAQGIFLAPTEVLSFQHYDRLCQLFKKLKITTALLTRSKKFINGKPALKNELKKKIQDGKISVLVGTHALLAEDIFFYDLGLVVIDEQHRFGVEQRKFLTEKSANGKNFAHLLSMTATPIPRSLALILYGDLDLSVLHEMPSGRKKIITKIVEPSKRSAAYKFIRERIEKGEQIFILCPLIDPSDALGVKSVTEEHKRLNNEIFFGIPMGILHGKMKPKEKEEVMSRFRNNEVKILVATSVIEVGIDVPNATLMMVEGAERFGLAQLHQFRGRVGRSHLQSYCLLFTENFSSKIRERLEALISSKDSFELAQKDLEFRGAGDIYGIEQSGFLDFTLVKLTDIDIIQKAKECAEELVRLPRERHPQLKNVFEELSSSVHLE